VQLWSPSFECTEVVARSPVQHVVATLALLWWARKILVSKLRSDRMLYLPLPQ